MYDELIKKLRQYCLADNDGCLECRINDEISEKGYCETCVADLMKEAADAIEAQQKVIQRQKITINTLAYMPIK